MIFIASNALMMEVEAEGVSRLNKEILISFGTVCLYHTHASKALKEAGIQVRDAIELASLEMIKQSVSCGIGIALVPEVAVQQELDAGDFKVLPLCPESYSMHGLIVHKNRELSYPARLVMSELTKPSALSTRKIKNPS